jgi:L-amino acid N-acyltransferase YncA
VAGLDLTQSEELVRWLCERARLTPTVGIRVIGSRHADGTLRGVTGYEYYTGSSYEMHFAGERGFLTREYLHAMFAYPFEQLKCKVVIARCKESRTYGLDIVKRLGFTQACVIPDAYEDGGMLIMTMRREDCKWLEKRHGIPRGHAREEQRPAAAT